jgi:hypothetical protein
MACPKHIRTTNHVYAIINLHPKRRMIKHAAIRPYQAHKLCRLTPSTKPNQWFIHRHVYFTTLAIVAIEHPLQGKHTQMSSIPIVPT